VRWSPAGIEKCDAQFEAAAGQGVKTRFQYPSLVQVIAMPPLQEP